jgi:translation initiation factor 3 subunit G
MRLVTENVCPEVAARANWRKFGDAVNDGPGPNISSTIVGEPVFLKLSLHKDLDREPVKAAVVEAKNIVCRYCQGGHWSAKCPYKSTFAEEPVVPAVGKEEPKLKYIPPSMRRTGEAASSTDGTTASSHRDNPNTIRISNLAEQCTDADIRDLVSRIATPARVYVVKDQRTFLCRGSAFVSFHLLEDAERCISRLNGHPYGNLILHVEMAKPQAP